MEEARWNSGWVSSVAFGHCRRSTGCDRSSGASDADEVGKPELIAAWAAAEAESEP
jgi:hypothetical protein